MCTLADFEHLQIAGPWRSWLDDELEWWHHDYLPIPEGGTILDVGAGCGETAQFYLNHGAAHVICIEANLAGVRYLERNFAGDPRVTIIGLGVDQIKIDIEGGEANLDLEIHFPYRWVERRNVRGIRQMRLLPSGQSNPL